MFFILTPLNKWGVPAPFEKIVNYSHSLYSAHSVSQSSSNVFPIGGIEISDSLIIHLVPILYFATRDPAQVGGFVE